MLRAPSPPDMPALLIKTSRLPDSVRDDTRLSRAGWMTHRIDVHLQHSQVFRVCFPQGAQGCGGVRDPGKWRRLACRLCDKYSSTSARPMPRFAPVMRTFCILIARLYPSWTLHLQKQLPILRRTRIRSNCRHRILGFSSRANRTPMSCSISRSISLSPSINVIGGAPGRNAASTVPLVKPPVVIIVPRTALK